MQRPRRRVVGLASRVGGIGSTAGDFPIASSFSPTVIVVVVSHWVMSDSLWPHGLPYTRLSCASPSPRVCLNSCPLSWWYHPTISSSVTPLSSCPQSFPASGSFLVRWLFVSGGQSIGASASASVLPVNIQGWFPLRLTVLIICSNRTTKC